jgi:hypothetical protein
VPDRAASYAQAIAASSSRYRVVTEPLAWAGAEADCADDGGGAHLAVIGSEAERAGVDDLLNAGLWIGLSDRVTEDTFRWVTGAASPFTAWGSGKPDDPDGTEDCVEQRRNMPNWDDLPCTDQLAYVCECDGQPPDPSTY